MNAEPSAAVSEPVDEQRVFVKVCGITTPDDALLAAGLGADAIGMIFAASSRRITGGRARDVVRRLPPDILTVGVFQNERRDRVVEAANSIGLRAVQLHGRESAEDTRWIAERVPSVIRVFTPGDPGLERADEYGPVQLMVDSPKDGDGRPFDHSILQRLGINRRVLLAGGLDPSNVVEAIETVQPWGVDVASGVEARPGHKDPVLLRRFIANARSARWDPRSPAELGHPVDRG